MVFVGVAVAGACLLVPGSALAVGPAELSITGVVTPVKTGQAFTATFTITNAGPSTATDVRFVTDYGSYVTAPSVSAPNCAYDQYGAVCKMGSLGPGASFVVPVTATPLAARKFDLLGQVLWEVLNPNDRHADSILHLDVADGINPVLSDLRIAPNRLAAVGSNARAARLGKLADALVFYRVSEPAAVSFSIKRAGRVVSSYTKTHTASGVKELYLRKVVGHKKLRPGRYTLVAAAKDAAGNQGPAVEARFRVKAPRG